VWSCFRLAVSLTTAAVVDGIAAALHALAADEAGAQIDCEKKRYCQFLPSPTLSLNRKLTNETSTSHSQKGALGLLRLFDSDSLL
jgi:hypothetical protein